MTVKEVADLLSVSPSLIYAWIAEGRLKCWRFGRSNRRGTIRVAKETHLNPFVEAVKDELADD